MLELWFDFSCPYAYLASRRAVALARRAGVELAWRPMLLGGVFRGIGAGDGPMATLGPAKAAHNGHDMYRWAEIFDTPFQLPATHPMRTVRAQRVLLGLPHSRWPVAIEGIYAAYWQRAEDITRDDVLIAALRGAGVPDADITTAVVRADSAEIKDELRKRTDEAIALGIFGAPAWVIRRPEREPLLLWGQDRMEWVEAALGGWDPDANVGVGVRVGVSVSVGVSESRHRESPGSLTPTPTLTLTRTRTPTPTTKRPLDVYFDISSPFAYLGLTQLPALAATVRLIPILLGGLFRDIGQVDVPLLAMPPAKMRYTMLDMQRWARWWGVPFDYPRKFPQRTIAAQRLCILAAERGVDDGIRLATALGRAMWAEQRDLEDPATLRAILGDVGLPPEWADRTGEPALKAALIANTTAAKAAGVFGVPTWVVDDKTLFWGQDRLELVSRALAGWQPEHG